VEELKRKQSSGTLTTVEAEELSTDERVVAKHQALDQRNSERDKTREARRLESKRKALAENPNVARDSNAAGENKTHAERLAKLERARDVAEAEERTDTVTRIDALIVKENQRHENWLKSHGQN
jgi:hypothetical protein